MNKNLKEMLNAPICMIEKPKELYISLEEIIRFGTVHGIGRNAHFQLLAGVLPKPDYMEDYGFLGFELCYGNISFVISNGRLEETEIYVDVDSGFIDGGKSCDIDYWHFEDKEEIDLLAVECVLNCEKIGFSVWHDPENDSYVELRLDNGVVLGFLESDEEYYCSGLIEYRLSHISF